MFCVHPASLWSAAGRKPKCFPSVSRVMTSDRPGYTSANIRLSNGGCIVSSRWSMTFSEPTRLFHCLSFNNRKVFCFLAGVKVSFPQTSCFQQREAEREKSSHGRKNVFRFRDKTLWLQSLHPHVQHFHVDQNLLFAVETKCKNQLSILKNYILITQFTC